MHIVRVASRQQGKMEISVFSGGQGDANFHSMYMVRVDSRQRGKFEILVFSEGQGCANFLYFFFLKHIFFIFLIFLTPFFFAIQNFGNHP